MIETASHGAEHTPPPPPQGEVAAATSDAIRELNCRTQAPDASPRPSAGDILQMPPDAIPLACLYERAK